MTLGYEQFCDLLAGERLPAMVVDLDAFDRNITRHITIVRDHGITLRPATKSIRVPKLLRRLFDLGGPSFKGLMCYSANEAAALASLNFDDLLIAYPTLQPKALALLASHAARGATIRVAVDSIEGVDALAYAIERYGGKLCGCLCLDMGVLLSGRYLGVRRSPLRTPEQVLAVARYARKKGVAVDSVLGYEAIVAGLADDVPGESLKNRAKAWLKRRAMRVAVERRAAVVSALRADGFPLALVNGGGTGSLDQTVRDPVITEMTAGSGFFKPHLFDAYRSEFVRSLEPACYFALEITRKPAAGFVTCHGGGYIASGSLGIDKIPMPWMPEGLSLLAHEMAGEVQTPLKLPRGLELALGSPVVFRHAKAGELSEHFDEALLVSGARMVERAPTYRGDRIGRL